MQVLSIVVALLMSFSVYSSDIVTDDVTISNSPNVVLSAALNLKKGAVSARKGNDIWGWTDPQSGKEYVMMGGLIVRQHL